MVKANRQSSQKAASDNTQSAQTQAAPPPKAEAEQKKGKPGSKSRSTIGGTAVQGARSTQPKELSVSTPTNQQPEYYNREMRRRMQHMGTGPYAERPSIDPRERKKKRQKRIQERRDEIKHAVDARGPSRDIKLGRRNAYFLIGIIALIVLLIVVFLIIRHPF